MIRNLLPLNRSHAVVEAQRCLGCHDAPCRQACPAHVDVPAFIARFREENLPAAAEIIYSSCPLGGVCGQVCPTGDLCEKACVLPKMGQAPVRIGALQAFITSQHQPAEPALTAGGRRVAVVGAGPAGLGCAAQLNRLGEEVHVFERGAETCGLVGRVIPSHRLPEGIVARDLARLRASGIRFHFDTPVDSEKAETLSAEFDAVFLGPGLNAETPPDVPLPRAEGLYSALEFLGLARAGQCGAPGRRVIVIGAGNVALDAAVVASRLGADEVTVLYRRGLPEMPAWQSEYMEACLLGVEFRWLSVAQLVHAETLPDGSLRVSGVEVARTRYSQKTSGGRRGVEPDPTQPAYTLSCDALIFALGQTFDMANAGLCGVELERGLLAADAAGRTARPNVFAAGEAVSGGSTVVACMSAGMAAGRAIHAWLNENNTDGGKA